MNLKIKMRIMTDKHSKSFFGQLTGLTIQSSSKSEPFIFLRCIKKKSDNSWEKPSMGEGKVIKINLEEIVMMLQVLNHDMPSWTSFHSYKDNKTQISFKWEDEKEKKLWINIGNYSKMLNFAQVEIFKLLLKHILKEKIKHATISNISKKKPSLNQNVQDIKENSINFKQEKSALITSGQQFNNNEISQIEGSVKGETEKALRICMNTGQELWVPKSGIKSHYLVDENVIQEFSIDTWILKKNKVQI